MALQHRVGENGKTYLDFTVNDDTVPTSIVQLYADGSMVINSNYHPDAAAALFWATIGKFHEEDMHAAAKNAPLFAATKEQIVEELSRRNDENLYNEASRLEQGMSARLVKLYQAAAILGKEVNGKLTATIAVPNPSPRSDIK